MKIRVLIIFLSLAVLNGCSKRDQHYQGYVEADNIYLASAEPGLVVNLLIKRGQEVKKGQLLFKLDPNPQTFQINQAHALLEQGMQTLIDLKRPRRPPEIAAINAQIKQADAQLSLADIRVKRNQTLYIKHVMDKDTLDASVEHYQEVLQLKAQYQANLDLANDGARLAQISAQQFQVKALQDKVHEAQWELAQKTMYAPSDGFIVDTYFRLGEYVPTQRPVASLLTPDNTHLEFFVPVDALANLHIGTKITFQCDSCARPMDAVISYVSPDAEYAPPLIYSRDNNSKLVFRVKANPNNPKNLKPGQPVNIIISGQRHA